MAAGCTRCLNAAGNFAVARYTPEGRLDPTFGAEGRVTTDFDRQADEAEAVAIQADGKIVAAGFAAALEPRGIGAGSRNSNFGLARYLPDGTLDPNFGTGGKAITDFADANDAASGLTIQPDGKILTAGLALVNGNFDFALARHDTDGRLDPLFGKGGKVTTDFGAGTETADADGSLARGDAATGVTVQGDGHIVAVGIEREGATDDFALARYSPNGVLDPAFGTGGKVTTDFAGMQDGANGVALAPNGRIVSVGVAEVEGNKDFAVALYRTTLVADSRLPASSAAGDRESRR